MRRLLATILMLFAMAAQPACQSGQQADLQSDAGASRDPFIIVLGIAQDGGYPQSGCPRDCCAPAWRDQSKRRHVSCLGIVDPARGERWMIDATPDFREQLRMLDDAQPQTGPPPGLAGILLTHAHIGHYTGLMFIGHESTSAHRLPVYAMPRMREFLSMNGPWDQLVRFENIELRTLEADMPIRLNDRITVTPMLVPHRDEYSETVGFRIDGPTRSVLFIPDIDKWDRWKRRIEDELASVDVAYVDGTFYANGELPNRDMTTIPHPFIEETMDRLESQPASELAKVRFIHLNHTNPALDFGSDAAREIRNAGFSVAQEGERFDI